MYVSLDSMLLMMDSSWEIGWGYSEANTKKCKTDDSILCILTESKDSKRFILSFWCHKALK